MADSTNTAHDTEALVRFAKRISHDINNYSTVVRTYSELMLADLSAGNPMHDDVEEVRRAADATVSYIHRVTQFARAGTMRRGPTPVEDGITDAVALLAHEHGDRTVELTTGGGSIHADASWWRDCVTELLRNAHEAAPPGTTIAVRSRLNGDTVVVDVEDAGGGIDPLLLPSITQPFVTSKQGVRGAGIGLAIVDAFTRVLQGQLTFGRVDGRTRVTLVLPCVSATTG